MSEADAPEIVDALETARTLLESAECLVSDSIKELQEADRTQEAHRAHRIENKLLGARLAVGRAIEAAQRDRR